MFDNAIYCSDGGSDRLKQVLGPVLEDCVSSLAGWVPFLSIPPVLVTVSASGFPPSSPTLPSVPHLVDSGSQDDCKTAKSHSQAVR